MAELRITETFFSLQGESSLIGYPTFFVRLTGCPLRCSYCDTEYAFNGGRMQTFDAILAEIKAVGAKYVCITGGEPLAQPEVKAFMKLLSDLDYQVSLETSGAMTLKDLDPRIKVVMDLKTPASGEVSRNDYRNFEFLNDADEIKFVVCDRLDYEWVKGKISEYALDKQSYSLIVSPAHNQLPPQTLADWVVEDRLPVRFQLQLHKVIWGEVPGR